MTLAMSIPYFIGETFHYVVYVGPWNYFLGYFCDLIAIALMLLASISSLKRRDISSSGWFAGAWGFAFCLAYRSFMWRYEALKSGNPTDTEPASVLWIIGIMMAISMVAFIFSLYLARPQEREWQNK